jgi:hypothetical protein
MKRIAAILAWMMLVGVGSAIGAGATGPVYMDSTLKQPIGIRSIKLNGSTSGSTVISAPAVASNCSAGQVLGFSDGAGTLQCAASSGGTLSGVNGIEFILTSTTTITATGTGTGTGTATGTATSAATFTRSGTATTTTSASDTLTATGMNGLGTITISSSATSTTVRTATFVGGVNWGHNPTNTASATSTTPVTVTATVTPTVTATVTGTGSSTSGITGTVSGTATGSGTGTNTAAEGGTTTMVATATTTYNNSQTKTLTGTWAQSVTQSGTGTISILVTSTATTTFTASSIQTVTCVGTGTGTTTVTGAVTASATGTGTGVMTGTEYQTATSATLPTTITYTPTWTLPTSAAGWLHDDGVGTLAWTTPTYTDVGADPAGAAAAITPYTLGMFQLSAYGPSSTVSTSGSLGWFDVVSTSTISSSTATRSVLASGSVTVSPSVTTALCYVRLVIDSTQIGVQSDTVVNSASNSTSVAAIVAGGVLSSGSTHVVKIQISSSSSVSGCTAAQNKSNLIVQTSN